MIQDPVKRSRVKRTLLIIIFVTIPCYLLGGIVLLVNEGIRGRATITPTTAPLFTEPPAATETPSLTPLVPTAVFPTHTSTMTPTLTLSPTATRTYVIPTSTPSDTPTITATETPTPSDTATATSTTETPTEITEMTTTAPTP